MPAPVKTIQTPLITWQDIASSAQVISSSFDCSAKLAAAIGVRLARRTGTAFTAGWPNIRIEASIRESVNDSWIPIYSFQPLVGASIVNTTLNGAIAANDATFVVTSASNIAAGDILFLGDASVANYELVRVKSISGTTVTPEQNVVNAHANAALVTDQAEMILTTMDLSVFKRLRAVVDNMGSGQAISVEVCLITLDSM